MLQSLMLRISDVLVNGDDLSLTPALTVLVGSGDRHLKVSMLVFPHVPLKTFPAHMAQVDSFGLFPSAVHQTLNKSSSFCLKIPISHYWSLQHRNSVIPASLSSQPLVL